MDNIFGRPVPRLGFGCMRLPENEAGEYIVEECQQMFDFAMSHGMNYFDSAWHYIESQQMIGRCLAKYPRESYILVGKLHFHEDTLYNRALAMEGFEKELSDARTDYMDLELMHAIGSEESLRVIEREDFWQFMRELKASGRVKHIGFSWHGRPEDLDRLLGAHPEIEVVQIQANYYDHNTDGARDNGGGWETYEICRRHGRPVIIMEPIKGGNLNNVDTHEDVRALFRTADPTQTASSWALRYAASLDGVLTVLSGMSTLEQMRQNYRTLVEDFTPLTEDEKRMLAEAARLIEAKRPVGCTGCHYCTDHGCPMKIKISEILAALNKYHMYQNKRQARFDYYNAAVYNGAASAKDCLRCGACMGECPQNLKIPDLLQEAMDALYAGDGFDLWANHGEHVG